VAFLHLAPELGALDRNRSLIEYGTRVAADSGADWVLSGELVVPGYRFEPLIGTNWIAEQPDNWMRRLARLSSDLGVASFVSHPERETPTGKLFNSLFVIGRNGQILGRHRKLKPTPGLQRLHDQRLSAGSRQLRLACCSLHLRDRDHRDRNGDAVHGGDPGRGVHLFGHSGFAGRSSIRHPHAGGDPPSAGAQDTTERRP